MLALQVAYPVIPAKPLAGFMLSPQALEEFKQIWKEEVGEEISDDFASAHARTLLRAVDKTYKPIKKKWLEKFTIRVAQLVKGDPV